MKKKFLLITAPMILLLPLAIVSCGSISEKDRIKNAKKKIANVVAGKIRPTLSAPVNGNIVLTDYLNPLKFNLPETITTGIEITLNNIEIPLSNASDLDIWFKVESTETLDIAPEISDYYSVKFSEIEEVKGKTIISPSEDNIEKLREKFEILVNLNHNELRKLIGDAIYGEGNFDGQTPIDVSNLSNSSEILMSRLTTDNINRYVFLNKQRNIYLDFNELIHNDENGIKINFNCTLGNDENSLTLPVTIDISPGNIRIEVA